MTRFQNRYTGTLTQARVLSQNNLNILSFCHWVTTWLPAFHLLIEHHALAILFHNTMRSPPICTIACAVSSNMMFFQMFQKFTLCVHLTAAKLTGQHTRCFWTTSKRPTISGICQLWSLDVCFLLHTALPNAWECFFPSYPFGNTHSFSTGEQCFHADPPNFLRQGVWGALRPSDR